VDITKKPINTPEKKPHQKKQPTSLRTLSPLNPPTPSSQQADTIAKSCPKLSHNSTSATKATSHTSYKPMFKPTLTQAPTLTYKTPAQGYYMFVVDCKSGANVATVHLTKEQFQENILPLCDHLTSSA